MTEPKANLVEIFSSYQGEGLFLGVKQIFLRFADCNLNCVFCDTPKDAVIKGVSADEVFRRVKELEEESGAHHSVSLTGGEPLLYVDFLQCLLPKLKSENFKIYLETNGTLTEELKRIIDYVDIIAMDIKLPSSADITPVWEKHTEFLKIAGKKNVFVKAVVTNVTSLDDIIEARDIIVNFNKEVPFVVQPASPIGEKDFSVESDRIFACWNILKEKLRDVKIVPQVHKLIGIK